MTVFALVMADAIVKAPSERQQATSRLSATAFCIDTYTGKRDEVFHDWMHGIADLSSCANVFIKLGGMGMPITGFGWHQRPKPPTSQELADGMA